MKQNSFTYASLERALHYSFTNQEFLVQALRRRSAINSGMESYLKKDNQRLEFLGDKVLGLVISDIAMENDPNATEGELTSEVAHRVKNNNSILTETAYKINLGPYIIMDRGEETNNYGRQNNKILGDTMEAIIRAIFLDCNKDYKIVKQVIHYHWYELEKTSPLVDLIESLVNGEDKYGEAYEEKKKKIVRLIKKGEDIGQTNAQGLTIFHYMGGDNRDPDFLEEIVETQKNWENIDLRGIPEDTFEEKQYDPQYDNYDVNENFEAISFRNMNFKDGNLSGVNFSKGFFENVNFKGAKLNNTNFSKAKFYTTNFDGADLIGANMMHCTMDKETRKSYYKAIKEGRASEAKITVIRSEFWEAIENNDKEEVEYFLSQNIDINLKETYYGLTPLHLAAGKGHTAIAKLLLENNADASSETVRREENSYVTYVRILKGEIKKDAYESFRIALDHDRIGRISLSRKEPEIIVTPFHLAAGHGPKEEREVLCRIGKLSLSTTDTEKIMTPLHLAVGNGHKEVIKLLLSYGALLDKPEWKGVTPLSLASKSGCKEIEELLLTHRRTLLLSQYGNQQERLATPPSLEISLPHQLYNRNK